MTRLLITHREPEVLAREIEAILGEALSWVGPDAPEASRAEVWFCAGYPPASPIALPSLRWIQSGWAGVDDWFARPEWRGPVALTRTVGDYPRRIAEYVFGYLLARELDVAESLRQMRKRAWKRFCPGSLAGRTLLIVGYGAVGNGVGAVGRALGMLVEGIRRNPTGEDGGSGIHGLDRLDECLPRADVVVNLLPHTADTDSFWGAERFSRLGDGVTFVNVSRGATVDEKALLGGVRAGRPARAILDVFREEPLPAAHPLREAEAIWITPHVAGIGTPRPLAEDFVENWRRYHAGLPLRHLAERARGY